MENIKCTGTDEKGLYRTYKFKVADGIAKIIRTYTKCPKDLLSIHFSDENEVYFNTEKKNEWFRENEGEWISTVEKIANELSTKEFYNKLLTNRGRHRGPSEIHEIIKKEYGLKDSLEWYTSHVFISISALIQDPEFILTGEWPEDSITIKLEFKKDAE